MSDEDEDGVSVVETATYRVTLGAHVEAAPNHHIPEWMEVELFGFDEPNAWARVELRDSVPRLVEIGWRSGPNAREVVPKDLRDNDLTGIVESLYAGMVIRVDHHDKTVRMGYPDSWFSREITEFLRQRRTGKRRITSEFLKQVAQVYRDNIGHAPTEAVARTFGVKHRQATDYVKQARERKFLPPTKQGRAKA